MYTPVYYVDPARIPKDPPRNKKRYFRALLDTGASRSVMGLNTARAMARARGERFMLQPSRRLFRFGVTTERSLGTMTVTIPTPSKPLTIVLDVVSSDIPFLLGLDAMLRHRLQPLVVANLLQIVPLGNGAGTVLRTEIVDGHMYLPFTPVSRTAAVFYSRAELLKLHRALYHPSARALFALLKKADPAKLDGETKRFSRKYS